MSQPVMPSLPVPVSPVSSLVDRQVLVSVDLFGSSCVRSLSARSLTLMVRDDE